MLNSYTDAARKMTCGVEDELLVLLLMVEKEVEVEVEADEVGML